jgi:hypothetical protein
MQEVDADAKPNEFSGGNKDTETQEMTKTGTYDETANPSDPDTGIEDELPESLPDPVPTADAEPSESEVSNKNESWRFKVTLFGRAGYAGGDEDRFALRNSAAEQRGNRKRGGSVRVSPGASSHRGNRAFRKRD